MWPDSGLWTGQTVDYNRIMMHALCNAANERQDKVNRTLTPFLVPSGTKTEPLLEDFSGTRRLNMSEFFGANILLLRAAVEDLVTAGGPAACENVFVEQDRTKLTLASLLNAGSYGNSWLTLEYDLNINVWLQLQEAFTALQWVVWFPQVVGVTQFNRNVVISGNGASSAETAWDTARGFTPSQPGGPNFIRTGWHGGPLSGPPGQLAFLITTASDDLRTDLIVGSLSKGIAAWGIQDAEDLDQSVEIEWVEKGDTWQIPPGAGNETREIDKTTTWPNIGTTTTVTLTVNTAEPVDIPSTPAENTFFAEVQWKQGATVDHTLTSRAYTILTSLFYV